MINTNKLMIQAIIHDDLFDIKSSKQLNSEQQTIVTTIARSISQRSRDAASIEEIDFNFDKGLSIKIIKKDHSIQDYSLETETDSNLVQLINRLSVSILGSESTSLRKPLDSSRAQFPSRSPSLSLNMFQRMIRALVRYFFYESSIKSVVDREIKSLTSVKSAEELKTAYITSYGTFQAIKNKILERAPHYEFYFENGEIDVLILAHLSDQINSRLKELKEPLWNNKTFQQLEASRLINDLKENAEGSNEKVFNKLYHIPALEIPINELKALPITSQNKIELARFWMYFIGNLFQQGKLDQLASQNNEKGVLAQTNYAIKYLNALQEMPTALKDVKLNETDKTTLNDFCTELEQRQKADLIRDFVVNQSLLGSLEIVTNDPRLQEKQRIFREYLHPLMEQERTDLQNEGFRELARYAAFLERKHVTAFVNKAKAALPEESRDVFTDSNLKELWGNEIERLLNRKGTLTAPQLEQLRRLRVESEKRSIEVAQFSEKSNVLWEQLAEVRTLQQQLDNLNTSSKTALENPTARLVLGLITNSKMVQDYLQAIEKHNEVVSAKILEEEAFLDYLENTLFKNSIVELEDQLENATPIEKRRIQRQIQTEKDKHAQQLSNATDKLKLLKQQQQLLREILDTKPETIQLEKILSSLTDLSQMIPFEFDVEATVDLQNIKDESIATLEKVLDDVKLKRRQADGRSRRKWKNFGTLLQSVIRFNQDYQQQAKVLQDQILTRTSAIEDAWIAENFDINHPNVIHNLLVATDSVYYMYDANLIVNIWKKVAEQKFNAIKAEELTGDADVSPDLKNRLDQYVQVKSLLSSIKTQEGLTSHYRDQVKSWMDELEKKISNEKVKEYIKQSEKDHPLLDVNEALFGSHVLKAIETSQSSYSTFLPHQQAQLMFLTKILDKTKKDQVLTVEEKNQVQDVLDQIQKDKNLMKQVKLIQDGLPDTDNFLKYVPGFLQGFVKRFVLRPEDVKPVIAGQLMGGVDESTIDFVGAFFYATKNIPNLNRIKKLNEKAKKLVEKYKNNPASIKPTERLSLKEIGVLGRFNLINNEGIIDRLTHLGVIERDNSSNKLDRNKTSTALLPKTKKDVLDIMEPSLKDLKEVFKETESIIKDINEIVLPAADKHYQDGSVLAYVGHKKVAWTSKPLIVEDYLATFLTSGFTHGAKLYHDQNGKLYQSEVWSQFQQEKMNLYNLCISDIWDINIVPLVDPSMHLTLKTIYGEKWEDKINEMYRDIEKRMHAELPEKSFIAKNSQSRRIAAGLANHPWLFGKLFGQKDLRAHEGEKNVDFNAMRKQLLGKEELVQDLEDSYGDAQTCTIGENQICSEFASRSTAVSMIELNERLSKDILDYFKGLNQPKDGLSILDKLRSKNVSLSEEVTKYLQGVRYTKSKAQETQNAELALIKILRSQGYSKEDIKLIIRLNNKEVFDLPYSKKERFEAIHPGRMVQLLVDKKCAVKRSPPKEMTALIAVE